MLDSRDNSVLKSLKELRKQEEDRVSKERAAMEAKLAAERAAKEEAERAAKEAEERARREEEDRIRREEEAKLAREREDRLRIEESERRARVEAEMQLQQEKMRLESEAKVAAAVAAKAKKPPLGLIAGIVLGIIAISGGIVYKIKSDHAAEAARVAAKAEEEKQRLLLQQQEVERRLEATIANLTKKLSAAKTESEREALKKQIDEARINKTRATHSSSHASRSSGDRGSRAKDKPSTPEVTRPLIQQKRQVSSDPLEGLKL